MHSAKCSSYRSTSPTCIPQNAAVIDQPVHMHSAKCSSYRSTSPTCIPQNAAVIDQPVPHAFRKMQQLSINQSTCIPQNAAVIDQPVPHAFRKMQQLSINQSHMHSAKCSSYRSTSPTCIPQNAAVIDQPVPHALRHGMPISHVICQCLCLWTSLCSISPPPPPPPVCSYRQSSLSPVGSWLRLSEAVCPGMSVHTVTALHSLCVCFALLCGPVLLSCL